MGCRQYSRVLPIQRLSDQVINDLGRGEVLGRACQSHPHLASDANTSDMVMT
ncbi:MAG: hypothetical protein K0S78_3846 [Thermomicrobiales bacterium]|nr:hypothetical protein [Thermomicrobiales bacterium]